MRFTYTYDPYTFDNLPAAEQKQILVDVCTGKCRPHFKNILFTSHPEEIRHIQLWNYRFKRCPIQPMQVYMVD